MYLVIRSEAKREVLAKEPNLSVLLAHCDVCAVVAVLSGLLAASQLGLSDLGQQTDQVVQADQKAVGRRLAGEVCVREVDHTDVDLLVGRLTRVVAKTRVLKTSLALVLTGLHLTGQWFNRIVDTVHGRVVFVFATAHVGPLPVQRVVHTSANAGLADDQQRRGKEAQCRPKTFDRCPQFFQLLD